MGNLFTVDTWKTEYLQNENLIKEEYLGKVAMNEVNEALYLGHIHNQEL